MSRVEGAALLALSLLALSLLAMPAAAQLSVERRADLTQSVVLGPDQAAVVFAFRRDTAQLGQASMLSWLRYDLAKRSLVARPADAKKRGLTTTYAFQVRDKGRKLAVDYAVLVVSAGSYVLGGATADPNTGIKDIFCFGAPVFTVAAGEVAYIGDFMPFGLRRHALGELSNVLAYRADLAAARTALAARPELTAKIVQATLSNGAVYPCYGGRFYAYDLPGLGRLPLDPAIPDATIPPDTP